MSFIHQQARCAGLRVKNELLILFASRGVLRARPVFYVLLRVTATIICLSYFIGRGLYKKQPIYLNRAPQGKLKGPKPKWSLRGSSHSGEGGVGVGLVHGWRLKALHCAYLCSTVPLVWKKLIPAADLSKLEDTQTSSSLPHY